jgi:hypothetical protein
MGQPDARETPSLFAKQVALLYDQAHVALAATAAAGPILVGVFWGVSSDAILIGWAIAAPRPMRELPEAIDSVHAREPAAAPIVSLKVAD